MSPRRHKVCAFSGVPENGEASSSRFWGKEEQGSGRMTLFDKKSVGAKRTLRFFSGVPEKPRPSAEVFWGEEEQRNEPSGDF